jgi:uncharacterized phage protein gp47/JayE
MAALTPKIYGPDGVLRETLAFSTTMEQRFFNGTISADTVDMEVSINGSGYASDPDLIVFEGTSWTMPNPEVYPEGLSFQAGVNEILVRAISFSGSTSAPASATVTLVQDSDIGIVAEPPTNISVEQLDKSVDIRVEGLTAAGFRGFNFYASQYPGGGATGYRQINLQAVAEGATEQETAEIVSQEVDSEVVLNPDGTPAADPLYFRIRGQQENTDGSVLQEDFNEVYEVPETARALRTSYILSSVRQLQVYSFDHNRLNTPASTPPTISIGEFAALPEEEPLYYVVTAVFYDSASSMEFESSFSPEVVGHPLRVTASIGTYPVVSRQQIVRDFVAAVFRSNPQIKVEEGSTLRDVVIDPFSSEAERVRFIVDFLHRCQSPTQLLVIDDPQGTGESAPVPTSAYKMALKQAFRLGSDAETQALINAAFESYASQFGVFRRPGRASRGEVTFYATSRPTRSISLPIGTVVQGGSIQFRTIQAVTLSLSTLSSYYDPISGRYLITVPVKATTVGASGNVGVGQVRRIVSSIPELSVINSAAMFGGQNEETNLQLSERARNRLASVDSGTKRGYLQTAADVPGVVKANVVGAGDPLMQRDLDSAGVHRGGKVDVWVQGQNLATVTDTYAFSFQIAQDIQFEIIGSPANLIFRAVDPLLSEDNPIVEMLDYPDAGYTFRNASTGLTFDLTNVAILSYDTIQLSTAVVQPSVDLTDVVLGSYRRRVGNTFPLPRQPVSSVVSVVGVSSGSIPDTNFFLTHPDSPLGYGRSTLAHDYLSITSYTDSNGSIVPSGDLTPVIGEQHVLIGNYPEYVDNLGAVFLTVKVLNADRSVQYRGPDDPSGISDYTIILGSQTTPLAIQRVEGGAIANGATVQVDYSHDENFTVTYQTNLIVSVTQDAIEANRHATADVVVKDAIPVPLDLEATVVLNQGADKGQADQAVRTNLTNFIQNLRLGDPIRQSDVIDIIERTSGVSYVVVPLSKLVRGEGSQVVRETLTTDLASEVTQIPSLSTESVLVWLIEQALTAATTNGGGPDTDFRSVDQDDVAMDLLPGTAQLLALGLATGRAFIIGSGGAVIQGLSDDATLLLRGYTTSASRQTERLRLTANHVLVSVLPSDSPVNHDYTVTYIVGADSGAKDIDPGAAEYMTVGAMTFTYDEDSA